MDCCDFSSRVWQARAKCLQCLPVSVGHLTQTHHRPCAIQCWSRIWAPCASHGVWPPLRLRPLCFRLRIYELRPQGKKFYYWELVFFHFQIVDFEIKENVVNKVEISRLVSRFCDKRRQTLCVNASWCTSCCHQSSFRSTVNNFSWLATTSVSC